jgi:hypothetical protein
MKLFLSTNENTANTNKIKMLEVAVKSALKNTNFDVYVIFDGNKNVLNLPKEVTIIEHRHRCYETFKNSNRDLTTSSGTFLRTEIPFLMKKNNIIDDYFLYTDYDVVFQSGDYSQIETLKPKIFAASPESNINDWSYVNAGVMVGNFNYFNQNDEFILNYITENFENLDIWDQSMYNNLFIKDLTKLPIIFNWKPYWGINDDVNIIHFHGPKPYEITCENDINSVGVLRNLHMRNKNAYTHYNQIFNSFL